MKTIQVTVERNFHIMNEDRFIMEKISVTIEPEEDTTDYAINEAREIIIQNFKAAYPQVHPYLNFDEVIQVNKNVTKLIKNPITGRDEWHNSDITLPSENSYKTTYEAVNGQATRVESVEKINKGTLEEQIAAFEGTPDQLKKEWFYPASMNKKLKDVYDKRYLELSK